MLSKATAGPRGTRGIIPWDPRSHRATAVDRACPVHRPEPALPRACLSWPVIPRPGRRAAGGRGDLDLHGRDQRRAPVGPRDGLVVPPHAGAVEGLGDLPPRVALHHGVLE